MKKELTAARVRELLRYDPATGIFTWSVARRGTKGVGAVAGRINAGGYAAVFVEGRWYLAHRLAWFYVRGEWPKSMLDHKNRIKTDNRLENLRLTDHSVNSLNRVKPDACNRSGFLGVRARWNRFTAEIRVGGEMCRLGSFDTAEAASAAYFAAKARLLPGVVI